MDNTSKAHAPDIAYLTGEYPAVSHTFILREVEALRALGLSVETCSVRRTDVKHHRGPAEKQAAATTFYIMDAAKRLTPLLRAQSAIWRSPGAYFEALKLAWSLRSPGWRAAVYQLFYFTEATVLAAHLRAKGVTHLHNHFADSSATVALLAARLGGIRFSFTLHGPADLWEPRRWALREKAAAADFVSCISYFARSQLMFFSDPADWDKLRIVHCGVLPELYQSKLEPYSVPDVQQGAHFVFVGRLSAVKGIRVLLDGFARAAKARPDLNLRLSLVGDGDDRAKLEQVAAPLGDAVQFLGYRSQDEVAEILSTAAGLLLPSFAEGVPVVLMEAMAAGKPVIASRVAGVSELVEDGVSGFLVPPGDVDSLAARIAQLAEDPALRAQMGHEGVKTVTAEFDIRKEAARLAALFMGRGGDAPRPDPIQPLE